MTRRDDRDLRARGLDNELQGKAEQMKGRVKDAVGGFTDDGSMQLSGKWDKTKGKLRERMGEVQQRAGRRSERRSSRYDDDI